SQIGRCYLLLGPEGLPNLRLVVCELGSQAHGLTRQCRIRGSSKGGTVGARMPAALLDAERRQRQLAAFGGDYQAGDDYPILLPPAQAVAFLEEQRVVALVVDHEFAYLLLLLLRHGDQALLKAFIEGNERSFVLLVVMDEEHQQVLMGIRARYPERGL